MVCHRGRDKGISRETERDVAAMAWACASRSSDEASRGFASLTPAAWCCRREQVGGHVGLLEVSATLNPFCTELFTDTVQKVERQV